MRTVKKFPTLMFAASIGTGVILLSGAAMARTNNHQEHNGAQDGNADRSSAPQAKHVSGSAKKGKGETSGTGTARTTIYGGNPPRGPVSATPPSTPPIYGGNPPRGPVSTTPTPTTPVSGNNPPKAPVASAPPSAAVVSNGVVKLTIANSSSGLTVTSNPTGTITVSNGDPSHSVTLPGGSVTISGGGVTSVGGASGVQVVSQPNGDFVAAATAKSAPAPTNTVTLSGGPEGGFFHALGSGLAEDVKDIFDPSFTARVRPENATPPPATSTSIQR